MPTPHRARGFTLLELLVGAAVGAVVLVGISLTFISQAQQYQAHASRRAIQSNARQSLAFMERHLRVAGYGVDPDRAILSYDSYNAVSDQQEQGYPDAVVVHWRDPLFTRNVVAADASKITVDVALKTPMRQGQILLVVCSPNRTPTSPIDSAANALPPHAFVTVSKYLDIGTTDLLLDSTAPSTAPNSPTRMPGRLFHEQALLGTTEPCFHSSLYKPQVVMIHRAAFYVAMFDATPYLMMHQGLDMPTATSLQGDTVIDANDAVPVAQGIEQLQLAYMLDTVDNPNLLSDPTVVALLRPNPRTPLVLGVESLMDATHYGENWEQISPLQLPPGWFFNPFAPYPQRKFDNVGLAVRRLLDHPANIRQVRMTLVARSTVPDPQIQGDNLMAQSNGNPYPAGPKLDTGSTGWFQLENLSQGTTAAAFTPSGGHYYRTILRQSVAPKNLLMNRQFVPANQLGGG